MKMKIAPMALVSALSVFLCPCMLLAQSSPQTPALRLDRKNFGGTNRQRGGVGRFLDLFG